MNIEKILLIPMAGYGKRFQTAGYTLPKQFLRLNRLTCLEYSLSSLNMEYFDRIIVGCREDFERKYDVKAFLSNRYPEADFQIVEFESDTRGSLETVSQMIDKSHLPEDAEIAIFTLDVYFESKSALDPMLDDAEVLVVQTNNPGFSFVKVTNEKEMLVQKTAEKKVISDFGAVGLYRFRKSKILKDMIHEELQGPPNYGGEYFICPIYNRYISANMTVKAVQAQRMVMFGTPIEYEFCRQLRSTSSRKVAVASDHSGFEAKEEFIKMAYDRGYAVDDFGSFSSSSCDYADFVIPAAQSVANNRNDFCVSFCRSGQGVNIAASAVGKIRSALIYDVGDAFDYVLKHNAPNHFSVPAKLVDSVFLEQFFAKLEIVDFEGGRHQDRLIKVHNYEAV